MRVVITVTGKDREIEITEALGPHIMGTTDKKLDEALEKAYKFAKQWIGADNVQPSEELPDASHRRAHP
jgi:hypothetical protein